MEIIESTKVQFSNITLMWKFVNFLRDELQLPIKGDNEDKNFVSEIVTDSTVKTVESDNTKYCILEHNDVKVWHIRPTSFKDKMRPTITIEKIRNDGIYFDKIVHTANAFC